MSLRASWSEMQKTVVLKAMVLLGFLSPVAAAAFPLPDFWYLAIEDYVRAPRVQLYRIRQSEGLAAAQPVTGGSAACVGGATTFVLAGLEGEQLIVFCQDRGLVYVFDGDRMPRLLEAGVAGVWPLSWNSVLVHTTQGDWKALGLNGQISHIETADRMPRQILALARNREDEITLLDSRYRLRTFPFDAENFRIGTARFTRAFPSQNAFCCRPFLMAQGEHAWFGHQTAYQVTLTYLNVFTGRTGDVVLDQQHSAFSPILIGPDGHLIAKRSGDRLGISPSGTVSGERNYFSGHAVNRWFSLMEKPIDAIHSRVIAVPNALSPWMLPPALRPEPASRENQRAQCVVSVTTVP